MSEQKTNQETRRPYSYHTFIFPFLFQAGYKNISREDFAQCLHKGFCPAVFESQKGTDNTIEYSRFRYFNQAARNAIYTEKWNDHAIVWNYCFNMDTLVQNQETAEKWHKGWDNPVRLILKKGAFQADLAVNEIRVKLFDTGVGMLVFELENYESADENSVTKINEYGRRVFRPFVTPEGECSLCADEVHLAYGEQKIVDGCVSGAQVGNTDEILLSPIISYWLTGEKKVVTTATKAKEGEFYIEPIIDDRMFVACVYNSPEFASEICQWDFEQNQYRYISDATAEELSPNNIARRFYEMVFIDADGLTCQNRTKLAEMNQEHSYARWIEYGTLTGISEYSMVCMTGDGKDIYNINPFLTEYVEMIILVLAQRASLLAFERAISEVTCKTKSKMTVEKIHRGYVAFESELLLAEVTSQQQGIELYDMMMKNLFIEKLKSDVESQINSLYEIHTADHESLESLLLNILAIIGAADIVGSIVSDLVNKHLMSYLSKLLETPLELPQWICTVLGTTLGFGLIMLIRKTISPIKRKF